MFRGLACTVSLLLALPALAGAQDRVAIGARAGYHFNAEDFSVGVEAKVPLMGSLSFRPGVDFILVDIGSYTAYNFDLQYSLTPVLYLGGGLAHRQREVADVSFGRTGGNLFAGFELPGGKLRPFAEGRAFLEDGVVGFVLAGFRLTL